MADEDSAMWSTILKQLRPNTAYTLVVKAFNTEGAGPLSPPVTVSTLEDGELLGGNTWYPGEIDMFFKIN